VRGSATKLNALFVREYLRAGHSIPLPSRGAAYEGGYTDIFFEGVARHVVHCDVQSLYPSIMLAMHLEPSKDRLKVFPHLLTRLRAFRLQCKDEARAASSQKEKRHMEAMQQAFKILINSFYGYLGTDLHNFCDPEVASQVTAVGRDLLKRMVEWLRKEGCEIVELDTDGIYFVPGPTVVDEQEEARLVDRLSKTLPEGIKLEYDGRYEAMFSYKRKNYALLGADGAVMIKGSGLRSRGIEPYLRDFMRGMLEAILRQDAAAAERLYAGTRDRLARHEIPLVDLCKTETLSETLESYQSKVGLKKRNRAAAYELSLQSGRPFVPGDQVTHYITGEGKHVRAFERAKLLSDADPEHPDENVAYYLDKLDDVYEKFKGYVADSGT
jgi:DNA polymerase I